MHLYWPLFDLRIATQRLQLQCPTDDTVERISEIVQQINRQPGKSWFWNMGEDAVAMPEFRTRALQALWGWRADWRVNRWVLALSAMVEGDVIGVVEVYASDFPTLKSFELGLWVAPDSQGKGFGREMAQAGLHVGFECLGANQVRWSTTNENVGSMAVARALGFRPNGTHRIAQSGAAVDEQLFLMDAKTWSTQDKPAIDVEGFEACRPFFGLP